MPEDQDNLDEFATTHTNGAAVERCQASWKGWQDFLDTEYGDNENVDEDEVYVDYISTFRDSGAAQQATTDIRHVYRAQGIMSSDLPPSYVALVKAEALPDNTPAEPKAKATATKAGTSTRDEDPPTLMTAVVNGRYAMHDSVAVGEFVRIGGRMFEKTTSCYVGVDPNGVPDGTAFPFSVLRKSERCSVVVNFDDDFLDRVVTGITAELECRFNTNSQAITTMLCLVAGFDTLDEVIMAHGSPEGASEAVLNALFGEANEEVAE